MPTASNAIVPFPAALLALAALASCGGDHSNASASAGDGASAGNGGAPAPVAVGSQLFPDNFKGVCSGAPVSNAAAYDPHATAHKALYFATYRDDFTDQSSSLPRDWTIQWSQAGDALRGIDLVVCARRTAAQQVKVCDNYQTNGGATHNMVRWHTATYELSLREAKTGRQLATTTAQATASDCPMFWSFSGDSDTADGYANLPDAVVNDFLRPHITG
jgi:hypothetical protein